MNHVALVSLLVMALVACQPSPFGLTPELEGTCAATASEAPADQDVADQVLDMGSSPAGSQSRCFEVNWPLDVSTFVRGFRVTSDATVPIARAEVYQVKTEESLEQLFGVDESEAEAGFECPGILGDDGLTWWFESEGDAWVTPQAGVRQTSGGARLLVRVVYQEALAAEANIGSEWLTTDQPEKIAQTTTIYDPYWLIKGGFDLPPEEPSVERVFIFDLATRLALESLNIHQVRMEVGDAAEVVNLSIERATGERLCVDHRTSLNSSSLTGDPLVNPMEVLKGDLIQLTCKWDTSQKSSPSTWSMTGELCRAVIIYTTEESP